MRYLKFIILSLVILISSGCAVRQDCKPQSGVVLPGTETAIVGLYIDEKGFPQANYEKVIVKPGQKILFAGPEEFEIVFKEKRSPIGKLEIKSTNGIVVIEIPQNIFERETRNANNAASIKELIYRYGIRVKGKETDPSIHVRPN